MDANEVVGRSLTALKDFRERVAHLGLWSGAWLGVGAVRRDTWWLVYLFRIHLRAAGVCIPSASVFDATTRDLLVRTCMLELSDCWAVLDELTRGHTGLLSKLVGEELQLYEDKTPAIWSFSSNPYPWNDRVHLHLSRGSSRPFHEIFGFELFDRLAPQLRSHQPPYNSLREIADGMAFFSGGGMNTNNANAQFEVTAELPIQLADCFYNRAHRSIEIALTVGKDVPLDRLSASLTPEPRVRVLGSEFNAEVRGDSRLLRTLIPSNIPSADVAVNVQFDDVHVGSRTVRAGRAGSDALFVGQTTPVEQWEATLLREFHWSRRDLRRALRSTLPDRLAEIAEWRIQESILLREEHPFFAVVSAASVAELLLKQRLGKVTSKTRSRAWKALRVDDQRLPRKVPTPDQLKFEQSIRLAQELGLLDGVDSKSVNLLRAARNEIHLDRKSRQPTEDFSPVRASQALLATLDLAKRLKATTRARPKKRSPVHSDQAAAEGAIAIPSSLAVGAHGQPNDAGAAPAQGGADGQRPATRERPPVV